jgi:hypothetical protein
MSKETLVTNKYFSSGLYRKPFYREHDFDINELCNNIDELQYNRELLLKEWKGEEIDDNEEDEESLFEIVEQKFWENLSYWNTYFEPLVFNEEVALECNLTPFTYKDVNLLALSGCGMDLSPRLDAYQALAHGTIDRDSSFFSINNNEYFEYMAGKEIVNKMNEILNR